MKKGFLLIVSIIAINFLPASMFAQDIQIDDGAMFSLTTGTYLNTISSTTQTNSSTATMTIGVASPATVTLSGDHTAYYGLFTFTDGSTLNYASAGPLTVPAKVNLANNTTATTFVKKNAAFTLSGDQNDVTFRIGNYGVLDLSDAANSGDLTLAKNLYFTSNTDANSYIKYRLGTTTYKIISTAGKIYTNETDGSIDVSKKFVFDMTDVTAGTAGETRNFTIATCQTLPVVSGTPTASNAGDWTNFAVTVTGSGPYNIVFSATYLPPVINVIASAGTPSGSYSSLKDAFDMINMGIHNGVIQIEVFGTSTETATCVLNANGAGSAEYESVSLYPTATGLRIVGDLAEPLIDLDGADNVTIDGRVNRTGTAIDLTIANLSTSNTDGTSTVRFINDATSNTIKYCTLKGSSSANQGGIIYFSTTIADNGNDNNIIDKNDITCAADANRPINAIGSTGSSGKENSGNIISNNKIYNFLNRGMISYGINLSNYNTSWSITGNSFYETASFAPTASVDYYAINVSPGSGTGFTINNNYIGGKESLCGGTAWTKTNAFNNSFTAINLNVGTGTASSVQGNTIRNFNFENSAGASLYGINVTAGAVNIGNATANTIGDATGNGSITLTNAANAGSFYGIKLAGAGTKAIRNNTIGSITAANTNSSYASNIYGIYRTSTGTTSISNNVIGSESTANSLYASSASTASSQEVYGITNVEIGTASYTFNTIANLNNASSSTANGRTSGIVTTAGVSTISDNVIHDLKAASNYSASVWGIYQTSTDGGQSIIGNTLYNLSNTYASYTGNIYGIYFLGGNTGTNTVSNNFVHSLSLTATSTANGICGISAEGGSATYSNNIVNLGVGITKGYRIYGIFENGASGSINNLYHNTVYIGGSVTGVSASNTYCLLSNSSANTRNFRSNIFFNARSNNPILLPTNGLHYAAYYNYAVNTGLTLDYNDYYVTGTGGKIGRYNSLDVTTLPIVTGNDDHSTTANPNMVSAGTTTATNYKLISDLDGVNTGITTDYDDITRVNYTMGAWEYIPVAPTTQASLVAFTSVTYTSMTVGWTNGNGSRRAVFLKEGAGTITNPTDLTTYTASANWASKGTQLGTSGYYCIYNGNSNTVDLTGLNYGTTYYVQVFEYNGPALGEKYNTTTATDNPNSQATPAAYFSDGTNYYGTWSEVASGISSGGTATLLADYTQPSGGVTILTDFTLDLNGHSFGGAQTSTIADSKSLGLKGSTGSFDGVISFAGTTSSLRILSELTFGTNFITAGSNGGVIIGDGTSSLTFACDNGDALFTHVASLRVKSSAVLALGEGTTYTPDIIIEEGGLVKLTSDASTYPNNFTTSNPSSASTAVLKIGNSTAISTTLTGNMADFYGRVTMVDGSQLIVNMAVSGKGQIATNAARFEVGGSSNVSATSLSFVAGLTLNNGNITGSTNSITIGKYGVLKLTDLTGALNVTYGNIQIIDPTDANHGYIQFGIAYTTTLSNGSFDIGTSIDVSSHFAFDMNNHVGTYGQTESFSFAITHITPPSTTGTPAPINANHWSDFSVTTTAPPPILTPTGWNFKLNALYYTPILYVDASKTDDTGDGLSWANAKKSLQTALDLSVSGYQIWVKEGTYYPSLMRGGTYDERLKTFQMIDGVAIYGGFDLTSPEATIADRAIKDNPTILSGDLDKNDLYSGTGSTLSISNNSENCFSVVRNDIGVAAVGPTAILDGFVIKGGNANSYGSSGLTYGGGGMHNEQTNPSIRNCRFEYNYAIYGGAFFSSNSPSEFYNCVFVNNYSNYLGGAIYNYSNGLVFNNCTIVNNYSKLSGGGITSEATSTILNNSIVWGNYSVNSGKQLHCKFSGTITLNYSCYQYLTNDVDSEGGTFTATNNDITTDPKFVDAPNGDFSIAGTSSCLDLGNDTYSTLTTDIRGAGFGRKLLKTDPLTAGTIDIGAYEYKFGTDPATLCDDAITVLNTNDAGAGSLRQAMLDICEDGIITFHESLDSRTITLTSGQLPTIDLGVTIDASTLTNTFTIDANNTSRIFNINCAAQAIVNIKNLTLINASTVGDGGGIYVASSNIALDLLDVDIIGCDAANGGAIYQTGGNLGVNSCGVTSNTATTNGGAVYVAAGTFTSTFSQYNHNTALYGGGLYVNNGTIELTNDSLLTNSASLSGGGFYLKEGSLTLSNSKVNHNTALTFGAGGFQELFVSYLTMTNSQVIDNICTSGAGAGLFVGEGHADISGSIINSNRAEGATDWGDGGAFYITGGNLILNSNIIKYNYAYRWGGALVLNGLSAKVNGTPSTVHSTNDTISCNSAETGVAGAIYLYQGNSDFTGTKIEWNESSNYGGGVCVWDNAGTTTFDQCTFSNNRTRNNASDVLNYGGAMFIDNSVVGVTSSTFTSNYCSNTRGSATPKGGAVYVYDGTFNATNSIFTSNVVTNTGSKGGAVFNDMADVNIVSCTFTTNAAGRNGGAIFTNQSTANTSSTNSTFTSNSAGKLGGALYLENGTMTNNNCDFSLNIATGLAGAAGGAINHNLGTSTTTNCEIFSNTADVAGGFYLKNGTANIVNSLFYGNSASTYGGALYVELSTAVLNITNTTIASNSTNEVLTMGGGITSGGGGIANQASTGITLHNTLLWNNTTFGNGAQIANIGSTPIVLDYCSYSNYTNDVFGTLTVTNSNTTFPNFVDPSADDYRLGGNSSSADAGLNGYCSESYDIRGIGFNRFRNKNPGTTPSAFIDLGAYEYQLTIDPLLGCTNPTNGGEITSDQSGCVSFDPDELTNVTLPSGENGTLEYKWQQSTTSAAAGFVDIASSTFSTYDPGTVSVNTWFRRLARVSCMDTWLGAIASNVVEMIIYPTSVGGTISGTNPITYGESTGTLTLSGFTGDVLTWQHKYGTAEFADISGTATSTFTETPVSAGTWTYRAEVQNGVCSSTWSDEFVVTVDKKTLTTSSAEADTKIYDGNTDATITGPVLIGIVSFGGTEDDVNLAQPYTGTFTTEIVGTHSVTASLSLVGDDKDNYNLTQPAGLSAEITAKDLTVSGASADNKIYDGNTDAEISGASLVGIVGLDDVDLDALTGTFASEIVGTHTVTATLTLKGTEKDNYTLTQPTGLSADITAKELTVSGATADNKIYDGNTDAEISGASLVGIVGLDDVDLDALSGTFASEIVGTHSVTATLTLKGTDKDNYSLTQPTGLSADITTKELTVSGASADDKVYDGNTDAEISGASLVGIVGLDDVDLDALTGTFESEIVGTHTVTATLTLKGTDKDNYSLTQPTGLSADITAKELTVSGASADDKVYDGNTDATISGASLVGIVGTDDVEFDDLTGVFESYLVGTHSVTATLTLMGTDKDNYSLTQPTGLTAEIYPGVPDHFTITSPGTATAGAASGNFVIALFDAFNNPTTSDVNATFNLSTNSTSGSNTFNPASPLLMLADTYTSTFTYAENRLGTFAITAVGATGPTGLIGESRSANITIQILPWQKASIGVSSGNTDFFPEINAGTFKQTAQGLSAPKNDVMNFEYQQLCGNGTVIARLADVVNGGWAGVMMRESNAVGSKTVLFKTKLYNPMANVGVRSTTNGNISNTTQNLPNIHWMKIQRTNANTFVVYTSYNGTTWIRRFTATVAMNNCINAGIFTENAVSGRTTTAWIDHAEVVGYLKDSDDENVVINTEDAFEVMIYPNPATDKVMITIPENEEKVKVTLINASGLVVETSEFNTMDVEYYINHIKPGMYLLRFERNGMIVNKRLVVL